MRMTRQQRKGRLTTPNHAGRRGHEEVPLMGEEGPVRHDGAWTHGGVQVAGNGEEVGQQVDRGTG